MAETKEDKAIAAVWAIGRAIAVAQRHPDPDDFADKVVIAHGGEDPHPEEAQHIEPDAQVGEGSGEQTGA